MPNLNYSKAIIAGRLTSDPQLKTTQSGISVCSFTVAVNRRPDANGQSVTDFFNVSAWRKTAEMVTKFFRKGSSILVDGTIQNRSYEKDGVKHTITEIQADNVYFVDSKSDNPAYVQTPPTASSVAASGAAYNPYTQPTASPMAESTDDELPF